ncbi:hypothetical protein [Neisseria shayeganii]|uniref:DUF4124 domain-containing protein n=1 Tax=Neisseria shayeganii 871 TaxID=1032488 RepID=G4CKW3_9NEIS|nr:hypothetical protein [Neisseria shayeganii]EGY51528.1 hypothetical protein HMPREF9371_2254 [Neisseria shayeganii 871]
MMKIFPLCLLLFAALPLQAQTAASDVPPPPAPEPVYICQTDDGRTVRTAVPQGRCRPFSREETVRLGVEETEASEPAAAAKPAGQTDTPRAYICQTPDGKAVFVSQPQGRCQPSHMDGAQIDTSPVAAADQELAKIWQAAEAEAEAGDVQVLPSMQVILRQQQAAAQTTVSTSIRRPPPRYVPPPKPPSRRELVERDIRREERALAREESELAAARLSRNAERIRRLSQTVNERRSGLRALREELRRYP